MRGATFLLDSDGSLLYEHRDTGDPRIQRYYDRTSDRDLIRQLVRSDNGPQARPRSSRKSWFTREQDEREGQAAGKVDGGRGERGEEGCSGLCVYAWSCVATLLYAFFEPGETS